MGLSNKVNSQVKSEMNLSMPVVLHQQTGKLCQLIQLVLVYTVFLWCYWMGMMLF
jgi:hypothetical protein